MIVHETSVHHMTVNAQMPPAMSYNPHKCERKILRTIFNRKVVNMVSDLERPSNNFNALKCRE